jgi:hypothetical protein
MRERMGAWRIVLGDARAHTDRLELAGPRGRALRPRTAALPAHAGFAGTTFLFAVDLRVLPATLREKGDAIVRLPARSSLRRPYPGAPKGGEPGGAF